MSANARSRDTSLNGGLAHLSSTFSALSTLDQRLAEIEHDLTGRNAIALDAAPEASHLDELELVPRMAETVIALAGMTQTLRIRLQSIQNTLRRPGAQSAAHAPLQSNEQTAQDQAIV